MMAQERHIVDEAYAGDIIGVFDPGIFSIGDTLTTAKPSSLRNPNLCTGTFCASASGGYHEA